MRRGLQLLVLLLVAIAAASPAVARQGGGGTPARRLTTIDALRQFPGYYHLQNVLVHGEFLGEGASLVLQGGERSLPVMLNDARTTTGMVEVRGQLMDIGRMEPGDPRLAKYENAPSAEQWPRPGQLLIFNITDLAPVPLEVMASVRALTLQPWRFEGQTVTLVGQFRGRNLFGDLPSPPGASRYDFVLRSADAAVWVTGLRPRGRGFDLDIDARIDTGGWYQVTGKVASARGIVTIAGTALTPTTAPAIEPAAQETQVPAAPLEPAEVVFSSITDAETGVSPSAPIRVQFSRGLDPATLAGRFRATYLGETTPLEIRQTYDAATRSIEIRFVQPLAATRTVRLELIDGMKAFDGAPVTAWTLTFSVAG